MCEKIVLTRHMVYGHGVLTHHALPILVGELFERLAAGHWLGVETGAEPFHGGRLTNGHGGLHALSEHPYVFGMREIIMVHQRVLPRVITPELYATPALGPQQHRKHSEHVFAVQLAQILIVEFVFQTVGLFDSRTAVRGCRRGRQHELYVRPVVRLVTVLGRDERDRLQPYGRGQRTFA